MAEIIKPAVKSSINFPIAVIGVSAGDLNELQKLVKAIPVNSGVAYVLVQHPDTSHESMLPDFFKQMALIQVLELTNKIKILPNNIYTIPANKMLMAVDGVLKLKPRPAKENSLSYLSIDANFTAIAEIYQSNVFGIVISGTGIDGRKGLRAIKEQGGFTFLQDDASAAYEGLPGSAKKMGVVDFILAPEEVTSKIIEITKQLQKVWSPQATQLADEEIYKNILSQLYSRKGTDFSYYKQTTIRRRILRRVLLSKNPELATYFTYFEKSKTEQDLLYQDLLIPVTSFFRDLQTFENLCETVFPELIKNKLPNDQIRIWVAGCSTGQEAYSIAMCFKEYLGHEDEKIQIFATDLSEPAISKARSGIYKKTELDNVSPQRLQQFFTKHSGGYQVNKALKNMCIFAVHNFLKDPPFSKMDFISCRNVLIYMEPYLQKRALTTFHYGLNPKGFLLLGKAENTGSVADHFKMAVKTDKLFNPKSLPGKIIPVLSKYSEKNLKQTDELSKKIVSHTTDYQKVADDILLNYYTPVGVVVNEAMEIVHFRGVTALYLEQLSGKPTHNLFKMAKPGLAFELRNLVSKVIKSSRSVKKRNISVQVNKKQQLVTIEAIPITETIEPYYLILFHEQLSIVDQGLLPGISGKVNEDERNIRIHQLEQELAQLRSDIRSITHEQEASNEELQSTNEELLSSNEEFQSLNEELETSKEELESTVEELTVVNQEMINLNEQLIIEKEYAETARKQLEISENYFRRLTDTVPAIIWITEPDGYCSYLNQPWYDYTGQTKLEGEGYGWLKAIHAEDKEAAGLDFLKANEAQKTFQHKYRLKHKDGSYRWAIDSGTPKFSAEGKYEGMIGTVVDIHEETMAASLIKQSEEKFQGAVSAVAGIVWTNNAIGEMEGEQTGWSALTGQSYKEYKGYGWANAVHPDDAQPTINAWNEAVKNKSTFVFEHRVRVKDNSWRHFSIRAIPLLNADGTIREWVGVHTDETEKHEAEIKLKESEQKFSTLAENMENLGWLADGEGWICWYNKRWIDYTGLTLDEMQGWGWQKVHHPDHLERVLEIVKKLWCINEPFELTFPLRRHDGVYRWFLTRAFPISDSDGKVIRWVGTNTDITEQRLIAEDLKKTKEQLELTFCNVPAAIYRYDKDGKILYLNEKGANQIGYTSVAEVMTEKDIFQFRKKLDETYDILDNDGKPLPETQSSTAITFRTHQPSEIVAEMRSKVTGESFWLLAKSTPLFDEAEQLSMVLTTSVDITFQKTTEQTLQYRKALLEAHNDASVEGILLVDTLGKIISYNKKFIEIWNMPQQIVDAKNDEAALLFATTQLLHPEQFMEKVKYLYQHPTETSTDILEFKDGKIVERQGYPVIGENGRYFAWSWTFRDITAIRNADIKIRESEHRYHNLIYSSTNLIAILKGREMIIEIANDAIIEVWGKGKDVVGKPYFEILPELADQGIEKMMMGVYNTGISHSANEMPVRINRQDNRQELRYYSFIFQPQRNVSGDIEGVAIIALEVTPQAVINKKIRESEENFRQLAELMPEKVSTADMKGNVIFFNKNWLNYSDLPLDELKGWGWQKIVHPDDRKESTDGIKHTLTTGETLETELRLFNKEGEYKWHLSRSSIVKDDKGQVYQCITAITEIHEQKEQRDELEKAVIERTGELLQANKSLLQSNEDLQQFAHITSHDLREPLRKITTFAGRLEVDEQTTLSEKSVIYLSKIKNASRRLDEMIEGVLSYSMLNASVNKVETININTIIENIESDLEVLIQQKEATIEYKSLPTIEGATVLISQLFYNLINNSLKFIRPNEKQVITITANMLDIDSVNYVQIKLTDRGIGFDQAYADKIFIAFTRLNSKDAFDGTGLGLTLCKKIVERHSGSISATGVENVGAEFIITLPLKQQPGKI